MSSKDPKSSHELPLLIREEARFDCTMCGSCCGGHNVGPVMPDIFEGLQPHMEELEHLTGTQKGLFFKVAAGDSPDAGAHMLCHSSGGSCVFLDDERRCIIHATIAAEAKPRICRLFPYQFTETPDGIAVSLQMECRGFPQARKGRPLAEQEAHIRKLLAIAPSISRVEAEVALSPSHTVSYREYTALEERLHEAVDANGNDETATILALRALLLESVQASDAGRVDAPINDSLDTLLQGFRTRVGEVLNSYGERVGGMVVHVESLEIALEGLDAFRNNFYRATRPVRVGGIKALFREKVHHALMGKEWVKGRSLVAGFASFAFQWYLALSAARQRAREVKRIALSPQDVMDALTVLGFAWRTAEFKTLLRQHEDLILSVFYHRLDTLIEGAESLRPDDRRIHFYKF